MEKHNFTHFEIGVGTTQNGISKLVHLRDVAKILMRKDAAGVDIQQQLQLEDHCILEYVSLEDVQKFLDALFSAVNITH